jgi:hypothetical protein
LCELQFVHLKFRLVAHKNIEEVDVISFFAMIFSMFSNAETCNSMKEKKKREKEGEKRQKEKQRKRVCVCA